MREPVTIARRVVALAAIGGALAGGIVLGRHKAPTAAGLFGSRADVAMPAIRPAAALGATWFCPGVPAGADGTSGSVVLANPTDIAASAVVTVTAGTARSAGAPSATAPTTATAAAAPTTAVAAAAPTPVTRTVEVAGRSRVEIIVGDVLKAQFAAVQVETRSGALAVEQVAGAKLDASTPSEVQAISPCANEPSEHWYFADGATTTDANETLLVYNPFPDNAVVNLAFADDERPRHPPGLQGIPVAPRSLLTLAIGDVVQRKEQVSVALTTKVGRVVLGRYQVYASKPRRTLVAGLATPSAGRQWTFADVEQTSVPAGADAPGSAATVFAVYNPGDSAAGVNVTLFPAAGGLTATTTTTPGATTTPAATTSARSDSATSTTTDADADPSNDPGAAASAAALALTLTATVDPGGNALIPIAGSHIADGSYSALVTSSSPVVVERQLRRTGDPRVVTTVQFGSRLAAKRWEFATSAPNGWATSVIVANPSPSPVTVTVKALGPAGLVAVAKATDVDLAAGAMTRIEVPADVGARAALVVEATGEVVTERLVAPPPDRPGSSASLGMPEVG